MTFCYICTYVNITYIYIRLRINHIFIDQRSKRLYDLMSPSTHIGRYCCLPTSIIDIIKTININTCNMLKTRDKFYMCKYS